MAEHLEEASYRALEEMLADDEEEILLELDGDHERSVDDIQDAGRRRGLDVYAMLGLPPTATHEEVKQAYKRLSGKYSKLRPSSAQRNRPSSADAQRQRQRQSERADLAPAPLAGERAEFVPPSAHVPTARAAAAAGEEEEEDKCQGKSIDPFAMMEAELVDKGYARELVRKALSNVGYSSVREAEAVLGQWGHAPSGVTPPKISPPTPTNFKYKYTHNIYIHSYVCMYVCM